MPWLTSSPFFSLCALYAFIAYRTRSANIMSRWTIADLVGSGGGNELMREFGRVWRARDLLIWIISDRIARAHQSTHLIVGFPGHSEVGSCSMESRKWVVITDQCLGWALYPDQLVATLPVTSALRIDGTAFGQLIRFHTPNFALLIVCQSRM